ncbi:MAG: Gfo/Idh/MocA family oxidoreductase [Verrucomicrobia bacterium]|nr:Gfo/Idh/MocA family oxidoreductase [Verrucomicrobiota bacterium]
MNRRTFLARTGAASVAAAIPNLLPSSLWAAPVKPGDRITAGLIGIGAMGSGHLARLAGDPGVQLVAVCDVDRSRRDAGRQRVDAIYAEARAAGTYRGCAAYNDYRELLARPDMDAVVIATPDHWHAMQSIHAAQAGKDVYCEKPVSLTLQEGRDLVHAIRRYGRVFQTGTQYRSIPAIRQVCRFVRHGGLGRVKSVFTLWNNLGAWIGAPRFRPYADLVKATDYTRVFGPAHFTLPAEPVPEGLDWDLWVGPAAWHDFNHLFHTNPIPGVVPWSFCEDFGAASVTWFHSHAADVIQYGLGVEESGPVELIHPAGGAFPTLTCRYANGTLLHLVEHWGQVKELYHAVPADARLAGNFGGVFVGERGWVTSMSTGGDIEGGPAAVMEEMKLSGRQVNIGGNNHHANWFHCIRSRARPSCHEELGHRSAALGHLTILAYKLGRSLTWDPVKEQFPGDEQANRLRTRALRQPWLM